MKFQSLIHFALQNLLIVKATSHVLRGLEGRQSGPVDPGTIKDCTYWETAVDATYTCQYFEEYWGLTFDQFFAYVSIPVIYL